MELEHMCYVFPLFRDGIPLNGEDGKLRKGCGSHSFLHNRADESYVFNSNCELVTSGPLSVA